MIEKRQAKIVNLFNKQRSQNKLSHAYLLVGDHDTYELSQYFAQSLYCTDEANVPCGHCDACLKIKNNEHADYVFISGKEKSIKKEAVLNIKSRFIQTSLEDVEYKVYVIEDVDNASLQALNSFLKFLEEPESNIIAILTTSNLNKVIETIKSRCMILHLETINKEDLENSLIKEGVDDFNARVLSYIASDIDDALRIHDTKKFHHVLDTFIEMSRLYKRDMFEEAGIILQVSGIKEHKFDLESINWLCTMHEMSFSSTSTQNIEARDFKILKASTKIKDKIRPGIISSMLIDQFVYELTKEA